MSQAMRSAAVAGFVAVLVIACGQTQPVTSPSAVLSSQTLSSSPVLPPPVATPAPSVIPSAPPAGPDLAWTRLSGLDVRGAVVAGGAQAGSTSVLLGADAATGGLASWTSADGGPWELHWLAGSTFGGGLPRAVVAGGPGFVALGWDITREVDPGTVVWTSPDGVHWTTDPDPSGTFGTDRISIAATSSSVVIGTCCDTSGTFGRPTLWTSTDGLRWIATTLPTADNAGPIHLAATATGYLAVSLVKDPAGVEGLALATWRSSDGRKWLRDAALDAGMRGQMSGINDVLDTSDGFMILDDGGSTFALAADGSVARIDPPASFATPAGGAAGVLWWGAPDIGNCLSAFSGNGGPSKDVTPDQSGCAVSRESSRVIPVSDGWLLVSQAGGGAGGQAVWAIRPPGLSPVGTAPNGPAPTAPTSAIPALPTGPLAPRRACPSGKVTIVKVIAVAGKDRVACFGSRDLTFRAWVVDPGEGYGGTCEPVLPRWLQDCVLPDWLLAAGKTSNRQLHALKHPGAAGQLKGVGRWVEVIGHFDDPAASTCRLEAGPAVVDHPPVGSYVLACREQFVVTEIQTAR